MKNTLEMEVHGLNELNRIMLAELKNIYPQLKRFVGKQIYTQAGDTKANFKIEFEQAQPKKLNSKMVCRTQQMYFTPATSSLWLKVTITCAVAGIANYFSKEFHLGIVENLCLKSLNPMQEIINDYQLDKIISEKDEQDKINTYKIFRDKAKEMKALIRVHDEFYKY
jgi:hypothetical protein